MTPRIREVFETIAAKTEVDGIRLTLTSLTDLISSGDNRHWIWKGQSSHGSPYLRMINLGIRYSPAQCLATYPDAKPDGFACTCLRHHCINPWHCFTFGEFQPVTTVPEHLARLGKAHCLTLLKTLPEDELHRQVVEYAYNPDAEIHRYRVGKLLALKPEAAQSVIDAHP